MAPFQDCLGCHDGSSSAPRWTVAGTWYRGSRVIVTDRDGKTISLTGNEVGNFYTAEPVAFPVRVSVDGKLMPTTQGPSYGGCNRCHHAERVTSTGPLMLPGQDCLGCHGPAGAASTRFSAAGTWSPGAQVTLVDRNGQSVSLTANEVGNFFTSEALVFPLEVSVDGAPMASSRGVPIPLAYGGCNQCHQGASVPGFGPLMRPGEDCLSCHGGTGVAVTRFSAAGTWRAGDAITVGPWSATANSAGNFYLYADTNPIDFGTPEAPTPQPAKVNGTSMEGGAKDGSCNRCHAGGGTPGG
jgi:hypothetical protein